MKVYYQEKGITLYHGDSREFIVQMPKFDLLLSDPPYSINHPTDYAARGRGALANCKDWPKVHGDNEPFDPRPWISQPAILFGANHFTCKLPESDGWIVWDKKRPDDLDQSTAELAWTNCVKGVRVFRYLWNGMIKEVRGREKEMIEHPTAKPVELFRWILSLRWTRDFQTIFDPYMGTSPVGRACKDLGKNYIGCEIEERYCEAAARRLSQEVLNFA